jgi:hypothetical protein
MPDHDEAAARRARADAIRRRRDRHNAPPGETETPADSTADEDTPREEDANAPNYAAWIEKKMRDKKPRDGRS